MRTTLLHLAEQLNTRLAEATPEEIRSALPVLHTIEARIKGIVVPTNRTLASDLYEDR